MSDVRSRYANGTRNAHTCRDGERVGKYRRLHRTIPEVENGVTPGREKGILSLDFGKIGLLICSDLYYAQVARELEAAGRKCPSRERDDE